MSPIPSLFVVRTSTRPRVTHTRRCGRAWLPDQRVTAVGSPAHHDRAAGAVRRTSSPLSPTLPPTASLGQAHRELVKEWRGLGGAPAESRSNCVGVARGGIRRTQGSAGSPYSAMRNPITFLA